MSEVIRKDDQLTNTDDLRRHLAEIFMGVKKGDITPAGANAAANIAGKILSSLKSDLEYAKVTGEAPKIKFLLPERVN